MPETGFETPTRAEIVDQAVADVASRVGSAGLLSRSLARVLAVVVGGLLHACHGALARLLRLVIWDTAGGSFLDRWAGLFGVYRLPAAKAAGSVGLTGTDGNVVTAGAELYDVDGVGYETIADATISGGVATVAVRALATGDGGNAAAGVELTFAAVWSGVDSIATVAAGGLTGGSDAESDADLLDRLMDRAAETPQGGAETDYEQWARAYADNVDEAWAFGNTPAAGDVLFLFTSVVAAGGVPGDVIPAAGVVTNMQSYLDALRPVTADLTVTAPVALTVDANITLVPNTLAVQAAAEAEIDALFQDEAVPGETMANSRFRGAIDRAEGETSHAINSLTVGGAPIGVTADIVPAATEIPVRGTITWV